MRVLLIALVMLGYTTIPGHSGPMTGAFRPVPDQRLATCKHYNNRSKFKERGEEAPLEVIFADSCQDALKDLYVRIDTNPYAYRRAAEYLDQLHALKSLIITINLERTFGVKRNVPTAAQNIRGSRMHTVSPSGEYLIARELGVLNAYRAWAKATQYR